MQWGVGNPAESNIGQPLALPFAIFFVKIEQHDCCSEFASQVEGLGRGSASTAPPENPRMARGFRTACRTMRPNSILALLSFVQRRPAQIAMLGIALWPVLRYL